MAFSVAAAGDSRLAVISQNMVLATFYLVCI